MPFFHSKHQKLWNEIANNIQKYSLHVHSDQYKLQSGAPFSAFRACFPNSNAHLIRNGCFACEAAKFTRRQAQKPEKCACPIYWGNKLEDPDNIDVFLPCKVYENSPYHKITNLVTTLESLSQLAQQIASAPLDKRYNHIYEVI